LLTEIRREAAEGDALVFIGDYIDRGPDSRQVVEQVLTERKQWDGPVVTLKGNHEAMMMEALQTRNFLAFLDWLNVAEGKATVTSYESVPTLSAFAASLPATHRRFFDQLALWHEDENGIYVHAGLVPGRLPSECDESDLLWIREPFIESDYSWGKPVIFGHTPQRENDESPGLALHETRWRPLNRPEKIGIDTGRGWGGPLTAVVLPERRFLSVA